MKCRAIRRKKLSFKILDVSRDDISTADTDTASSSERRPLSTSGARKHSLSSPRRKGVRFTEQVSPVCSLKKNGGLIQINLLVDWILIDIIANNRYISYWFRIIGILIIESLRTNHNYKFNAMIAKNSLARRVLQHFML